MSLFHNQQKGIEPIGDNLKKEDLQEQTATLQEALASIKEILQSMKKEEIVQKEAIYATANMTYQIKRNGFSYNYILSPSAQTITVSIDGISYSVSLNAGLNQTNFIDQAQITFSSSPSNVIFVRTNQIMM